KQVEDILEKYWNDHRMDETIEYLVTYCFDTPFDFFQSFGTYWEERGWGRIGHQLEDLFTRLREFLQSMELFTSEVESVMKYDYLMNQRYKPRKLWWEPSLTKQDRSLLYQKLLEDPLLLGTSFAKLNLTEKEIYK